MSQGAPTDLVPGFPYAAGVREGGDVVAVPLLRDPAHAVVPAGHPAAALGLSAA